MGDRHGVAVLGRLTGRIRERPEGVPERRDLDAKLTGSTIHIEHALGMLGDELAALFLRQCRKIQLHGLTELDRCRCCQRLRPDVCSTPVVRHSIHPRLGSHGFANPIQSRRDFHMIDTVRFRQVENRRADEMGQVGKSASTPLAIIAFMLAAMTFPAKAAERIEGRATVTDGDTIAVEGTDARIRLYGIDAPESGQTCDDAAGKRYLCGTRSADHLAQIIGRSGRVTCFEEDRDRYGRIVAECSTTGNVVINAEMVRAGWAVEYDEYSDGRYDQEEANARSAKRGIWQGTFVEPSKWRRGDRLQTERVADGQPKGCAIKGNISSNGRIYHMPGQQAYSKTKIDVSDGERWFCSPGEAEAAGWRAAKR